MLPRGVPTRPSSSLPAPPRRCPDRRPNLTPRTPAGKDAGEAYIKLAEVNIKLESKHDSASAWVEAAKAFQKVDQKSESERDGSEL